MTKGPREPAGMEIWESRTRNGPKLRICTIVTNILSSSSVPQREIRKYNDIPVNYHELLEKDTGDNQCKWLKEALNKLLVNLESVGEETHTLKKVLIEGEMLYKTPASSEKNVTESCEDKMLIIEEFTWLLQTIGLETTVIYREEIGLINCNIITGTENLPFQELGDGEWPFPEI